MSLVEFKSDSKSDGICLVYITCEVTPAEHFSRTGVYTPWYTSRSSDFFRVSDAAIKWVADKNTWQLYDLRKAGSNKIAQYYLSFVVRKGDYLHTY